MHLVKSLRADLFGDNEWEAFTGLYDAGDSQSGSVPAWVADTNRHTVRKLRGNFPKLYEALRLEDESVWKGFSTATDQELPVQVTFETGGNWDSACLLTNP